MKNRIKMPTTTTNRIFTKLGKKIIADAFSDQPPKAVAPDDSDDSFYRYNYDDDVQYHGGHDHDHDAGLTDDQKYEKAMK